MIKPKLTYYNMGPKVVAFSSTRYGGFSEGNYASFNVNEYCSDSPVKVMLNRIVLCHELGVKPSGLIMPHQVHGTDYKVIDKLYFEKSSTEQKKYLEGVDALITHESHVCIGVSTADCVPVLIYDKEKEIVAAIHAGWRGTQKHITEMVVNYLCQNYTCDPTKIKAVIGPSIGLAAFEVGYDTWEAFQKAQFDMDSISEKIDGNWHIDLWKANKYLLTQTGIPVSNIYTVGICTYEHSEEYFSARKLTTQSGRILSGIMIKEL